MSCAGLVFAGHDDRPVLGRCHCLAFDEYRAVGPHRVQRAAKPGLDGADRYAKPLRERLTAFAVDVGEGQEPTTVVRKSTHDGCSNLLGVVAIEIAEIIPCRLCNVQRMVEVCGRYRLAAVCVDGGATNDHGHPAYRGRAAWIEVMCIAPDLDEGILKYVLDISTAGTDGARGIAHLSVRQRIKLRKCGVFALGGSCDQEGKTIPVFIT